MWDDSDEDISDLNIQSKTWKKLEENMKSIGFLEGAAEGKKLALQDGFNVGYSYGFNLGKQLGILKGKKSLESELKLSPNKSELLGDNSSSSVCTICINKNIPESSDNRLDNLISAQQKINDSLLKDSK